MPSDRQITTILSPQAWDAWKSRQDIAQSKYASISLMCTRYADIVARSLPDLTRAEWTLVLDALNGCVTWDAAFRPPYILVEISDHISLNQADQVHDVDGPALLAKLHALSLAQITAVLDRAEQFWAAVGRQEDPAIPGADPETHPGA